jgi:hypothetical protein
VVVRTAPGAWSFPSFKAWIDGAGRLPAKLWQWWLAAQGTGRALSGLAWRVLQLTRAVVPVR